MLFHSIEFLFYFLPVTWLGFLFLVKAKRYRAVLGWLTAASLFFYSWWNPSYLWLILLSIAGNYTLGHLVRPSEKRGGNERLGILCLGLAANLGTLAYFKYANFFVENLNRFFHAGFNFDKVILPLAISFFTFQQIVFLVESYRGAIRDCGLLEYAFSVSFFPHLVAGPIVQYHELLPQIKRENWKPVRWINLQAGATFFILGLFKKMVLGDGSGDYVAAVFPALSHGAVFGFEDAWVGALAYAFQIYFDFSGYSDMAIGLARCFGIQLPINFSAPYRATSIIEFWRRWHITLSRFLRNYLYIPLGGGKKGMVVRYRNLALTMLLGGLWHGAAWTFVIWGGLHGAYLIVNHAYRSWVTASAVGTRDPENLEPLLRRTGTVVYWGLTMLAVTVAFVFFRASSLPSALSLVGSMFCVNPAGTTVLDYFSSRCLLGSTKYVWLASMLLIVLLAPTSWDYMKRWLPDFNPSLAQPHRTRIWSPTFTHGLLLGTFVFFIVRKYYVMVPAGFLYFNF